ncbi:MAG: alpha/beta fold hydrolase [Bacteroidota bacterium]
MKRLKIIIVVLALFFVASYLAVSYTLSNKILQTNSSMERTVKEIPIYWNTTFEKMMDLLPEPSSVQVTGFEEVQLHAQYFEVSDSARCVFIFSHGWGRNWPNMLKYYPVVQECGCNVVMYDHRAHGKSGGKYPTGGIKESKDLLKITEWVKMEKGYSLDQIAWAGSSWGAATVLMAGASDLDPAFIVADSPFQDWYSAVFERAIEDYGSGIKFLSPGVMQIVNMRAGVNFEEASPLEKAKEISEPVFLIHSEADPETSSSQSVNISEMLNRKSEFHHTPWGNEHVMDVINNQADFRGLLKQFIIKNDFRYFKAKTDRDSI